MADIKFNCPECRQKIAVDESAGGMHVDCPNCRSTLVIPKAATGPVEIIVRRRLVSATGHADSAYEELERKQKELAAALQETAKWRADTERSKAELSKIREETGDEINRLKTEEGRFKTDLEKTRGELAEVRAEREKLARELAERPGRAEVGSLGLGPGHSVIQERLVAGEKERAELRAQLAEAQRNKPAELSGQSGQLQEQLKAVTAERDTMRTVAMQAETELKNLRVAANDAQAQLESERARLVEITGKMDAAQMKSTDLEGQLEEMRKNRPATPTKGGAEEVAKLQAEFAALTARHRDVQGKLAAQEIEREQEREQHASMQKEMRGVHDQMGTLREENQRLFTEHDEAHKNFLENLEVLNQLQGEHATVQEERDVTRREMSTLRGAHDQLSAQHQEVQQALKERQDELTKRQDELSKIKDAHSGLEKNFQAASEELSTLRDEHGKPPRSATRRSGSWRSSRPSWPDCGRHSRRGGPILKGCNSK
jgi:chromosome segregation ATPase